MNDGPSAALSDYFHSAFDGRSPQASVEGVRIASLLALFALDVLCIFIGFSAASLIHLGSPFVDQGVRNLAVVLPTFVAVALHNKSYSVEALERPGFGIRQSIQALLYACALAIALLFYLKLSAEFSRLVFAIGTVLSLLSLAGVRHLFGSYVGHRRQWVFRNRLVIVDGVAVTPQRGDSIVSAEQMGLSPGCNDPLARNRIGGMIEGFDSVVLACPPERRRKWSHTLKGAAADVEVLMPELSHIAAIELRTHHGRPTLVISAPPLGIRERVIKRTFDLVVASIALVLLAPLMLAAILAVRIESSGPVLFHQQRVGRNNKFFRLLKFRSMYTECSDSAATQLVSKSDPRVTRVGRFLRATSIDELPQLFNVLAGDMSIVGPRPHALAAKAEDTLYWDIDRRYFHRHAIKPGLTGLAQVRGFRGETARRDDLTNRLQSDLEYLSNWTIFRDLRIIAATFAVLVHPRAF